MRFLTLSALIFLSYCSSIGAEETSEQETPPATDDKKEKPAVGRPFSWGFLKWEEMKSYGGTSQGGETVLDPTHREAYKRIYETGLSKKERDRRAIKALCGDFRVSFDFIETNGVAENYKPQRPYFSWATERAFLIEETDDKLVIQHILVMEFIDEKGDVQGPFTMKHWRQDWTYEDSEHHVYTGERTWKKETVENIQAGSWSQTVYQVDDSPRYETTGQWRHEGGLSTFTTEDFWRPLPRREFSIRKDYNVLAGAHQLILSPTGWLHSQNNRKLLIKDGKVESTIATEVGAIRYEALKKPELTLASTYWEKTGNYWKAIREKWVSVYSEKESFTLQGKVDEKALFMHHFEQAGRLEGENPPAVEEVIKEGLMTIDTFLTP